MDLHCGSGAVSVGALLLFRLLNPSSIPDVSFSMTPPSTGNPLPTDWSESLLIDQCLAGSGVAIGEFVTRFQGLILGVCQRILGHRQDAEDVTQETLLRSVRSLSRFDRQRPLQPWILQIAVNRCRTLLGTRRHRPLGEEQGNQIPDARPGNDHELAEELQLAIGGLREEYRICFVLYHHQQLSLPEISEILDCPVGTLKTWLHRARRQLAIHLTERGLAPTTPDELH